MELASGHLLFKWFHDFSSQTDGVWKKLVKALLGSGFVDCSQNVEQLTPDWGVASVRDAGEVLGE